ncbi:fumarylacetoacetate hydrolase family protein [Mesobacterium pallidum]|uniref:fumarylacetoacetate hydrolase family protein n=1 Tax=Mesobacterium pallidum TaxID=2872037 RepID=UPI001EE20E99|nr:fumarylacetoacetate hydrolase family protein [Mesobacterium pallidum]
MKFASFSQNGRKGLAVETDTGFRGLTEDAPGYPGSLLSLLRSGQDALPRAHAVLAKGAVIDLDKVVLMPPVSDPEKIVCVGLNYSDHSAESGFEQPDYPTLFGRFNSSLIGHGAPILRPDVSEQLDYEGELVAIIGREARNVPVDRALDHVAGYSIFNDASVRDYQFKAPQWTAGKNFDDTGAFGPVFVTSDALPAGCQGLTLITRLNGQVVQQAPIDSMVFSVAELVSICSDFMTLRPGDVIVTGTPSGVGLARDPKLWMKDGDVCEVEITGLGVLSNPIRDAQNDMLAKSA